MHCFITHGSSNANAIKNAVRVANDFAEREITAHIQKEMAALHPEEALEEVKVDD